MGKATRRAPLLVLFAALLLLGAAVLSDDGPPSGGGNGGGPGPSPSDEPALVEPAPPAAQSPGQFQAPNLVPSDHQWTRDTIYANGRPLAVIER